MKPALFGRLRTLVVGLVLAWVLRSGALLLFAGHECSGCEAEFVLVSCHLSAPSIFTLDMVAVSFSCNLMGVHSESVHVFVRGFAVHGRVRILFCFLSGLSSSSGPLLGEEKSVKFLDILSPGIAEGVRR